MNNPHEIGTTPAKPCNYSTLGSYNTTPAGVVKAPEALSEKAVLTPVYGGVGVNSGLTSNCSGYRTLGGSGSC